ncbi:MAG: ribokinase [Spirochaetota bacterium]|nr:ribokinase [Spirochaetota bacterium]
MSKKFFVVGSINMDLSATVERFPVPGETVLGKSFFTSPGGKGGNQACALGRLGADVHMVGKIGDDQFGSEYLKHFEHEGIHLEYIETISSVSTGIAVIEVASNGENRIVIIPGANAELDTEQVDRVAGEFDTDSIVLLQLEIPIPTVLDALKEAKARGALTILDPAPAVKLPEELFRYVDYLTPNTTEIEVISEMNTKEEKQLQAAASKLLDRGVGTLIVKQGPRGADIFKGGSAEHIPGFTVRAVDTTAAGDSFNAGFAYGLGRGYEVPEAVRFAHAVAALSTEKMGAQTAMPTIEDVGRLYS